MFDQNVPKPLAGFLSGHDVWRAAQMGWEELKNGDLLRAAEKAGFDLLVSCDRNLTYQQNLQGRAIAVVQLSTNNWPVLRSHVAQIAAAVDQAVAGSYREVQCGVFVSRRAKER